MAALQRFKLLATQCGVAQSPTRSPRTSPVVLLRRRKTTLRMLLTRTRSPRRRDMPLPPSLLDDTRRKDAGRSLRDLFVSSPPPFRGGGDDAEDKPGLKVKSQAFAQAGSEDCGGLRIGPGSPRPGWIGFRSRSLLLRKVWRPVLVGIPE